MSIHRGKRILPQQQAPSRALQLIERNAKTTSRKAQVPAAVLPALRPQMVGSLRAGRNLLQVQREFDVTLAVAVELWHRDSISRVERRIERLEDQVAVMKAAA
ncbi:MAG TPA: hypothetical protein VN737_04285 [Bryobacteraceae bacterium]|nr:hypothetical protein [Bryobacteraceae bacterium]